MVTKRIELDGDTYEVKFDAYFPIFYREVVDADFFADESAVHDGDNYAAIRIAYAAVRYNDESMTLSYKEWLQKYDIQSILNFALEVLAALWASIKTSSTSKKK